MKRTTALLVVLVLVIVGTLSGCVEEIHGQLTYLGNIQDFEITDTGTLGSSIHVLLTLDDENNSKIYFQHRDRIVLKIRKGQQVYEDEEGWSWILIDGKYY